MANRELLSRGRSAEVYDWGEGRVLKLFHQSRSSDLVELEAGISDAAFRAGLPVPEVFETTRWKDRPGIVFEKIDGISMLDACIDSPQNADEYGQMLADIHHEIHDSVIEMLPELTPRLVQKTTNTKHLSARQKKKVLGFLENQAAACKTCHMDFHPDQVLMTEKGPRVIDWETACRGNPLADVARTVLILRIGEIPRPAGIPKQTLVESRNRLIASYRDRYFAIADSEITPTMDAWDLVAAVTRLAETIDGEKLRLMRIIEDKIAVLGAI